MEPVEDEASSFSTVGSAVSEEGVLLLHILFCYFQIATPLFLLVPLISRAFINITHNNLLLTLILAKVHIVNFKYIFTLLFQLLDVFSLFLCYTEYKSPTEGNQLCNLLLETIDTRFGTASKHAFSRGNTYLHRSSFRH